MARTTSAAANARKKTGRQAKADAEAAEAAPDATPEQKLAEKLELDRFAERLRRKFHHAPRR